MMLLYHKKNQEYVLHYTCIYVRYNNIPFTLNFSVFLHKIITYLYIFHWFLLQRFILNNSMIWWNDVTLSYGREDDFLFSVCNVYDEEVFFSRFLCHFLSERNYLNMFSNALHSYPILNFSVIWWNDVLLSYRESRICLTFYV